MESLPPRASSSRGPLPPGSPHGQKDPLNVHTVRVSPPAHWASFFPGAMPWEYTGRCQVPSVHHTLNPCTGGPVACPSVPAGNQCPKLVLLSSIWKYRLKPTWGRQAQSLTWNSWSYSGLSLQVRAGCRWVPLGVGVLHQIWPFGEGGEGKGQRD